ncbi:unnamed protein product [Triticum turgidum subsp. durum]|uniref:FAE domain-containing protein n=1 Tax=Triticum turgidum subsp. durum TaxID=4567 RepID=A0A9R0Q129_TRITD|nr:unnamed protein product [Triticum turgidum subsp. durum]
MYESTACNMASPPHVNKHLKPLFQLVVNNFLVLVVAPVTAIVFLRKAAQLGPEEILSRLHGLRQVHVLLVVFLPLALATLYLMSRPRSVYLVDYACCRPKSNCRVSIGSSVENVRFSPYLDDGGVDFMTRMHERSGLGDQTYLHPSFHYIPPRCCLSDARDEAEQVIFAAVDDLFAKTGISPGAIDILVTNCSGFNPTPSLADIVVNKYKLRADIRSVHVSGMGCSAGVISLEVVRNLLQAAPRGARALMVSTEGTSIINYAGKNRGMLLPYALFRMGAAAVLLSTSKSEARFRLMHIVRTLTAAQDRAYLCISMKEDDEGETGAYLSKDLVPVAGEALKANITAIGSLVLPPSEKLRFAISFIMLEPLQPAGEDAGLVPDRMMMAAAQKDEEPSDPQLQKIVPADPAVGGGPAGNPAEPSTMEIKKKKKKKKKVLIQVPDSDVKRVLSYKEKPIDTEVPELWVRRAPKLAANLGIMWANLAMLKELTKGRMLEEQRNYREQLKTKGRVTYELEVDEDDPRFKDESTTSAGAGRRRYRPGVMKKQDGHTRKLN